MSPSHQFHVVVSDRDHAKATAFNMLFMVWRYETTLAAYRHGIQVATNLGYAYPEGIGIFQIVEVDAVPPSAETRKAFVDLLRLPCVKHFSVAHEGVGFKAAAVRAIVAAGHSMARPKCTHSVHNSVNSAAEWHELQQQALGRSESWTEIARSMTRLRTTLGAQFPA